MKAERKRGERDPVIEDRLVQFGGLSKACTRYERSLALSRYISLILPILQLSQGLLLLRNVPKKLEAAQICLQEDGRERETGDGTGHLAG